MISGPSGSGKELVARAIHRLSGRAGGPFIVLNAATITPERMEETLFGAELLNGAGRRIGALEEAHGGTLYLDEVGDMPRETQNKVPRVLVDQSFLRVGGSTKATVDVRIVSSTARDLEREIGEGDFREGLFHRLAVVPMRVPALAERREDIPELVRHFVALISRATGLPQREIGDDAMAVLQAHDWPGNLRQLRNNVETLPTSCPRRRRRGNHGGNAAGGDRRDAADDAGQGRGRAPDVATVARRARDLRARISRRRRSTASAATYRGLPSSSAWSDRRCTGS